MNQKKNYLVVGRGSTAIYLILHNHCYNKEIIVPSNICYAAILPIYYSGNIPHFVDINYPSGNLSAPNIAQAINENTGAVIFPYMYGNITPEIHEIKRLCKKNHLLLIEDCASAMGGSIDSLPVGYFGDYAVFSTGHAKNVDLDNGGLIATNFPLNNLLATYQELPLFTPQISQNQSVFTHDYNLLRRSNNLEGVKSLFDSRDNYKNLFLYQLNDYTLEKKIIDSFFTVEKYKKIKLQKYQLFKKNLPTEICYHYNPGSLPWRFSILIKNMEQKQAIINKLLSENLFVSDWYPCIAPAFNDNKNYPNAKKMEKEILNFSLLDNEKNIIKICDIIKSIISSGA